MFTHFIGGDKLATLKVVLILPVMNNGDAHPNSNSLHLAENNIPLHTSVNVLFYYGITQTFNSLFYDHKIPGISRKESETFIVKVCCR